MAKFCVICAKKGTGLKKVHHCRIISAMLGAGHFRISIAGLFLNQSTYLLHFEETFGKPFADPSLLDGLRGSICVVACVQSRRAFGSAHREARSSKVGRLCDLSSLVETAPFFAIHTQPNQTHRTFFIPLPITPQTLSCCTNICHPFHTQLNTKHLFAIHCQYPLNLSHSLCIPLFPELNISKATYVHNPLVMFCICSCT